MPGYFRSRRGPIWCWARHTRPKATRPRQQCSIVMPSGSTQETRTRPTHSRNQATESWINRLNAPRGFTDLPRKICVSGVRANERGGCRGEHVRSPFGACPAAILPCGDGEFDPVRVPVGLEGEQSIGGSQQELRIGKSPGERKRLARRFV